MARKMQTNHLQTLSLVVLFYAVLTITPFSSASAQQHPNDKVVATSDLVRYYSHEWTGERSSDGRPFVSDALLQRLKKLKVEDVWQFLNELGYRNQFEAGWRMLHDDQPMVGRALTAQYMPARPDVQARLIREGHAAGHVGSQNSWPIDLLNNGDIYIADSFGKISQGTLIGDKLGTSIFTRSKTGVVFNASIRDTDTLAEIEGFNAFVRDFDPTFLADVMLTGINVPIRIGNVTVFPGDVILAKNIGIVFVPPHLVEKVVITAEIIELRDEFSLERVRAGVYVAGQVDSKWTDEMEADFLSWLRQGREDRLPVPINTIQDFLKQRTW